MFFQTKRSLNCIDKHRLNFANLFILVVQSKHILQQKWQ
jgi:hypothetical protein